MASKTRLDMDFSGIKLPVTHCTLCMQLYNRPTMLMCGHSWCSSCVQLLVTTENGDTSISCPQCRIVTNMKVKSLPLNYGMIDLIGLIHKMEQQGGNIMLDSKTRGIDRCDITRVKSCSEVKEESQHTDLEFLNSRSAVDANMNDERKFNCDDVALMMSSPPISMNYSPPDYSPPPINVIHPQSHTHINPPRFTSNLETAKLVFRKFINRKFINKITIDIRLDVTVATLQYRLSKEDEINFNQRTMRLVWHQTVLNRYRHQRLTDIGIKRGDTLEIWG